MSTELSSQNVSTAPDSQLMSSEPAPESQSVSTEPVPDSQPMSIEVSDSQPISTEPAPTVDPSTAEVLGIIEDEDGVITMDGINIPAAPVPALTNECPDSRLIIHSLEVENFKSYAGKQVIGPFNKNFTAVVGPNGSGKSNVIDSLLFVFGYRARKIRSKKVSHLIHKSDKYSQLKSCSVTVHFAYVKDEGEKGIILPDSRFSLKRTAHSDDTSSYEMNKKRVQYKEVSKRLRAYGVDLEHSRFLILQGEIEAISLMHPKAQNEHETGMLEYIEDIIGSNRFIEPIKHFQEKVHKLNTERGLMSNQLKLIEKEKDELEGPKNKAIEYLRLENKLCKTENALYHLRRYQAEKSLEDAVENKKKFVEKMKNLKSELENIRTSKKSVENSLSKLNSEYDLFLKKHEEKKEEYSALEREDTANLMQIKHAREKVQNLEKSLETTRNELQKVIKQSATFEQETAELQERKKKLEEEKEVDSKKLDEVMGSLKQETNIMQEKKDKLEAELVKLKNKSYQFKSEMNLAQSELKILKSGEKKEKEKLDSLTASYERAVQSSNNEEKLTKSQAEELNISQQEISKYKEQIEQAKQEETDLTNQLKSERVKLEEARITMTNSSHGGKIVQAFMKEKAKGHFSGVYGRLGDLGAIDEEYDVAISTACPNLNNIVTDTVNTAQECIQYLKKYNLGYATFIPLEKMKKWERHVKTRIQTPENVPRLFDLIRVKNDEFLTAFYHVCRDTLVGRDLDQATRVGLGGSQRYRVVTIKGEVVDAIGTMSGGGGKVSRGLMGQNVVECTVTNEEVNLMSANVEALTRKLSNVRRNRMNLEEQISQKTSIISSLQHTLKKRNMNLNAHKESVKVLSAQIEDQRQKISETVVDEDKVKMLEASIKEKNKLYTKAVDEESVVENKVSSLQAEILQISKGKLNKFKKNVTQIEKKLTETTDAITKSNVNMRNAKKNCKKYEDKIKSAENEIKANKEKLDNLKKQQSSITVKGTEITKIIQESDGKFAEFKEKKAELKKELDSFSEKEHKLKQEEIEHKNQLKTYESSESEKRVLIKSINGKLSKLKLTEVEDDPTELPTISLEEVQRLSELALTSDLEVTKIQLEDMKPDLSAIKEFKAKLQMYESKQKEVDDITEEKDLQQKRFDYLENRRAKEFLTGFSIIAKKLKEIYQMLTQGGDAEVELVDTMTPFSKGIEFSVRPPKKSWKYMRNLSGGEKTLSSLALVFALHYYRPTPFYVMDEIDAALDVRNVAIVGFYLKETTKNTQFIIVSLRNVMNELSDHLLGIYKIDNCTKNVSLAGVSEWKQSNARNV